MEKYVKLTFFVYFSDIFDHKRNKFKEMFFTKVFIGESSRYFSILSTQLNIKRLFTINIWTWKIFIFLVFFY